MLSHYTISSRLTPNTSCNDKERVTWHTIIPGEIEQGFVGILLCNVDGQRGFFKSNGILVV
eukprot:5447811-Amphidinium_carterae.1